MQETFRRSAAGVLTILGVGAAVMAAAQTESFVDNPPPLSAICPAIDEDYDLCSSDLESGNCRDFVTRAQALGRLYLFNVQQEPNRTKYFRTSNWWGCGSRDLSELAALLTRIDSPAARAVLQSEPYRSLPATRPTVPAPHVRAPAAKSVDCDSLQTNADWASCLAKQLTTLKAEHERLFDACKAVLPAPLRSQLVAQEKSWNVDLEVECTETSCMNESIQQRDREIREAFPQCGKL